MEKLDYPLPEKAIEILNGLLDLRRDREDDMMYLAKCCSYAAYRKAKRFFQDKSNSEENYEDSLVEYMIGRGYKPVFPKENDVDKDTDIEFTGLKSAIKYGLELCIETTEEYEKAIKKMFDIDMMSYNYLLGCFGAFSYDIKEWTNKYKVFEDLKDITDEREFESILFAEKILGDPLC